MEVETKCCGKEMIKINCPNYSNEEREDEVLVCGECGKFLQVSTISLDDEELLNYIENNEELQDTKIHKELIKNGAES